MLVSVAEKKTGRLCARNIPFCTTEGLPSDRFRFSPVITIHGGFMSRRFCLFVLLVLALPAAMFAQANAVDAVAHGYIFDASNSAISNAHVVLTNTATGISMETVT